MTARPVPAGDQPVPVFGPQTEPDSSRPVSLVADHTAEATWAAETLDALERLPDAERSALHLIYWRHMTLGQVAAELAISEPAVQTHVVHGMRALADLLADSGRSSRPS
jgi:DNA-directed RNA polymerase specialized sigma24 family protein